MEPEEKAICRYIRKTKKYMFVTSVDKRGILESFRMELSDFNAVKGGCSYEMLIDNFGQPCDVARELVENAGLEENRKIIRTQRLVMGTAIAGLLLLLSGVTCNLLSVLSHQEVSVTETIYYDGEEETVPPDEVKL